MTRYCSDITRHMRLFELIRQQNLAALRMQADVRHAPPAAPDALDRFIADALRSFAL